MLKSQQFENTESDTTKPKISKRPCINENNNKKRQSSDQYNDKIVDIFLFFPVFKKSQTT